ncbi:EF-hand domain-containing protein [Opacimonas viscosa]|mgnify:CR=1 FL=1|uniref:EF-hand domain-containing protein n=1 Tax=Opacimonas viscosa TaxID=2961944 RepID=A0AA41WVJ9_9ALTE|nr:EF-hand domain-containing protein [Opacimonas viscosa]MCP3427377.1 EF-hand domain-containing protein [Opacimonas viscosa]
MTKVEMSEKELAQIKQEFDFFDRDSNGQLSLTEFIELLTVLSPKTKVSAVEEGFNLIDDNHDGFIDFEEFANWWKEGWWEY